MISSSSTMAVKKLPSMGQRQKFHWAAVGLQIASSRICTCKLLFGSIWGLISGLLFWPNLVQYLYQHKSIMNINTPQKKKVDSYFWNHHQKCPNGNNTLGFGQVLLLSALCQHSAEPPALWVLQSCLGWEQFDRTRLQRHHLMQQKPWMGTGDCRFMKAG